MAIMVTMPTMSHTIIKFEMFETENSYQCHFAQIGTFVVSIAHYMRAYFNYQALSNGRDFSLPSVAGYLNCVLLQGKTETSIPLYAKIGCMERETFTSTKLQIHVYTDAQCAVPYDDGQTARYHANRGYLLKNAQNEEFLFSTKVGFRPPFYSCQSCNIPEISETFNKQSGTWYDDDYISQNGQKQQQQKADDEAQNENQGDDGGNANNNNDDGAQANSQSQRIFVSLCGYLAAYVLTLYVSSVSLSCTLHLRILKRTFGAMSNFKKGKDSYTRTTMTLMIGTCAVKSTNMDCTAMINVDH